MRVVIVAYADNLPLAQREAQDVSNILQEVGHQVFMVAGPDATLECLGEALDHGPFDLAWIITHSGPTGFVLAEQTISPAQLGQWLDAAHCWEAVLNSCFSAEHVAAIQVAAHVDVVATIDPSGVDDRVARSTGRYLARAYAESGDLQDACQRASGNGSIQYRWFPAGSALRAARTAAEPELVRTVAELVTALTGGLSGEPGLFARLNKLSTDVDRYIAANEAWKMEHERRHAEAERHKRGPLGLFMLALALMVAGVLLAGCGTVTPAAAPVAMVTPAGDAWFGQAELRAALVAAGVDVDSPDFHALCLADPDDMARYVACVQDDADALHTWWEATRDRESGSVVVVWRVRLSLGDDL